MYLSEILLVECESGDWAGLYVNGKLDYEGHEVSMDNWMDVIKEHKFFKAIDRITVTDKYMEAGLPNSSSDIPTIEIIEKI